MTTEFEPFLKLWHLVPDGTAIVTDYSRLLPVRRNGEAAMLKLTADPSERLGARLMAWWGGEGAARILELSSEAVVVERAIGSRSLASMAEAGRDSEATTIICRTVSRLHRQTSGYPADLVPLQDWFRDLLDHDPGERFRPSIEAARRLLSDPRDVGPLHGDIHHGNILDFGQRGWLAIDPKGLVGERGFDYANLFFNPDHPIATKPGRLEAQLAVVSTEAMLDPGRLADWILAWAGLSAIWSVQDGHHQHVEPTLRVAAIAESLVATNR